MGQILSYFFKEYHITESTTSAVETDIAPAFRRIRELLDTHRTTMNKHDLAVLAIGACITEGMDGGSRITGGRRADGFQ